LLQDDWIDRALAPKLVSSGSTEMQFDCTEQSPQASQTAGLISTRRRDLHGAALARPALSAAQVCTNTIADVPFSVRQVSSRHRARRDGRPTPGAIIGPRIKMGIFGHQIDVADCLPSEVGR